MPAKAGAESGRCRAKHRLLSLTLRGLCRDSNHQGTIASKLPLGALLPRRRRYAREGRSRERAMSRKAQIVVIDAVKPRSK
jgi:hypothetical protein